MEFNNKYQTGPLYQDQKLTTGPDYLQTVPEPDLGPGQMELDTIGKLTLRLDVTEHGGSAPHINQDILGTSGKFSRESLGPSHFIGLPTLLDDNR
jgi:hypothetical protein